MSEPSDQTKPRRRPYEITDDATWALVRRAYLGGLSARDCADKFDVSVHAIKRRITREGWGKHAFANAAAPAAGPPEQATALEPAFIVRRSGLPPLTVDIEEGPSAPPPGSPADMAQAAFSEAAKAFAEGRVEAAQRLLKLAGEARKMADAEAARLAAEGAGRALEAAAEAEPPPLQTDEVVISVDRLISLTEHWAAQMIRGELGDLPAFLIHAAAHWRRTNLIGPILYSHDFQALEKVCAHWHDEVFDPEGRVRALPSMEDVARCYVWGHRDFPALAQVPPRMRELQEATVEVVRRAKPEAVDANAWPLSR